MVSAQLTKGAGKFYRMIDRIHEIIFRVTARYNFLGGGTDPSVLFDVDVRQEVGCSKEA
jgi:hypothetical protein